MQVHTPARYKNKHKKPLEREVNISFRNITVQLFNLIPVLIT